MPDVIAPSQKVTFTVTSEPHRVADRKTIMRLMRMQPTIQRGLRRLAKRRKREDNYSSPRAGRDWVTRMRATKLARVEKGEQFTLLVTAQLMPDIKAVEKFLDAKRA